MLKSSTMTRYSSRSDRRQSAAVRVPGERVDILKLSASVAPNPLHGGMLDIWIVHVMFPRYLEATIRAAVGDIPVRAVRFQNEAESSGPSVLYRMSGGSELSLLDGSGTDKTFEIECRSPTIEGAAMMIEDILAQFATDGRLTRVIEQFDDAANPSSIRGDYYSVRLAVRLS